MTKFGTGILIAAAILAPAFAADPPSDWRHYLKDSEGTRYAPLDQINRANVKDLRVAWVYKTGNNSDELKTTIQCNPLIVDGVMYMTSPLLEILAVDAATGKEIWTHNPFPPQLTSISWLRAGLLVALLAIAALGLRLLPSRKLWAMRPQYPMLAVVALFLYNSPFSLFPNPMSEERRLGPNRGLTYWENGADKRIFFAGGHRLVSLDARTGTPVKGFGADGSVDLTRGVARDVSGLMYTVTSPGVIYGDVIILGFKVGEGPKSAAPGDIRAFDIHTGRERWTFHTIPRPGEPGYETWPPDAWKSTGGANAWGGLSLDERRGIVFASTGSPTFDLYGGDRIGANLFGDSVLALNAATGKLLWHYQIVHHDLWDYDLPGAPALVTLRRGGKSVDAAVQLGKNGMVYVFDRETGKPLIPIEERPVPASEMPGEQAWPTQPFPVWPPPLARQQITEDELTNRTPEAHAFALRQFREAKSASIYSPPSKQTTIVTPGFHGGSNWSGASFDPVRAHLIANTNDVPFLLKMYDGRFWAKYKFGFMGFNRFVDNDGYPAIKPPWGKLTAMDLNEEKVAWQVPLGEYDELTALGVPRTGTENAGGSVITAGGLVFIAATRDEKFRAFDIDTGRVLWETKLKAGGYATPSVYAVNGKQYVVIAAGGGGIPQTRSGEEYVAFTLPGGI